MHPSLPPTLLTLTLTLVSLSSTFTHSHATLFAIDPSIASIPITHNETAVVTCSYTPGTFCLPAWTNLSSPANSYRSYGVSACTPSMYCAANALPRYCNEGSYCPDTVTELPCPTNYYCPKASTVPTSCPTAASCPSGSSRYFHTGAFVYLALLLVFLLFTRQIMQLIQYVLRRNSKSSSAESPAVAHSSVPLKQSSATTHLTDLQVAPFNIDFTDIHAKIGQKVIVNHMSGSFRAGRLTAIIGPSGAGKSSLINALTGALPITRGSINATLNGAPVSSLNAARVSGQMALVPQDDIMIATLTVYDILLHSARTRLPASFTAEQKRQRVQHVMELLQLTEIQHEIVGDDRNRGISGGQRKRVNIGIELVAKPSLLFLDEPTTGLDATTSVSLVQLLKDLTATNTAVVSIIHQARTEIFKMFDDVLLLGAGGNTIYFGPVSDVVTYFARIGCSCPATMNISDYLIDVVSHKQGVPTFPGAQHASEESVKCVDDDSSNSVAAAPSTVRFHMSDETATAASPLPELALPATKLLSSDDESAVNSYLQECWTLNQSSILAHHDEQAKKQSVQSVVAAASALTAPAAPVTSLNKFFNVAIERFVQLHVQLALYFYRQCLQYYRNVGQIRFELFMHVIAGAVIGMAFVEELTFIPPVPRQYVPLCPEPLRKFCENQEVSGKFFLLSTFITMALGLVAAILGTRLFGEEQLNCKREMKSGASLRAYFMGKTLAEIPLIALYAFTFTCALVLVAAPPSTFADLYVSILLFEWVLFSLGYLTSTLYVNQDHARLTATVAALLAGLGTNMDGFVKKFCWGSWFSESLFIGMARMDLRAADVQRTIRFYADITSKFDMAAYGKDCLAMFIFVLVFQCWAHWNMWRSSVRGSKLM